MGSCTQWQLAVNLVAAVRAPLSHPCVQVFKVGDESFSFAAHPLATCDLVRVPESSADEPCLEVAQLQQRLHVQVGTSEATAQQKWLYERRTMHRCAALSLIS